MTFAEELQEVNNSETLLKLINKLTKELERLGLTAEQIHEVIKNITE